jgi:hypothetical protein
LLLHLVLAIRMYFIFNCGESQSDWVRAFKWLSLEDVRFSSDPSPLSVTFFFSCSSCKQLSPFFLQFPIIRRSSDAWVKDEEEEEEEK